jgi:hypothetical protein
MPTHKTHKRKNSIVIQKILSGEPLSRTRKNGIRNFSGKAYKIGCIVNGDTVSSTIHLVARLHFNFATANGRAHNAIDDAHAGERLGGGDDFGAGIAIQMTDKVFH